MRFNQRSMPHFKRVGIVTGLLAFLLTSCNPEQKVTVAPTADKYQPQSGNTIDPVQIDTDIKAFYQKMKDLRTGTSSEHISPEDALFLIEGTYNKYLAERQFDCDVVKHEFTVKVPVKGDGSVNMKDVSDAFYNIKDELLRKQNELGGSEVGVESFDMDVAERPTGPTGEHDGFLLYNVITIYKRPAPGFPIDMTEWCNDYFHEEATHVWQTHTQSTALSGWPTKGQAKINHANKLLVANTVNMSLPGAASSLRAKGVGNYQKFYCKSMMCGYFVNISGNYNYYPGSPVGWPNEYVGLNIPDYANNGSWSTIVYNTGSNDPFDTYKHWITTPMMNYYLSAIPGIINANVAVGKQFANFHVTTNTNTSSDGTPTHGAAHWYQISSGDFIETPGDDCTGKLELGYL